MAVTSKRPRSGAARRPAPGPGVRATVSTTSAERFARRVRARRRRRVLIGLAVLTVLAAPTWGALKSPWATVTRIEVTGTDRIAVEDIQAEAEASLGRPLLLVRTEDLSAAVGRQRLVRSVRVQRQWPGTLRIQVVERVPVAALPDGAQLALVDRDGVVIERVREAPAGLPRLEVELGQSQAAALRGSLEVLQNLPTAISDRLLAIGADSPDGIWLTLSDSKITKGARVEWGDSSRTEQKARVLSVLLPQHALGYDVRSPDSPAMRRK